MKTVDIRNAFLEAFESVGHKIVSSSSLVPENDPSLLFTTAGMVQFKDTITGKERRSYTSAATCQKCVRAGGKHNDLEQVGYTPRHHTFFEMLGNFSFGGYFKAEAIEYAWTFLTRQLKLAPEKLYVTVYHTDIESAQLWKKIAGLSDTRILFINSQDNFWAMGDTGPCGPCSEIFFDHGSHLDGGLPGTPKQDGNRFVELWNLVFMQFERTLNGDIPLAQPCIDTGMGLERISAVMQGVHDNFHTDLFLSLTKASKHLCANLPTRPSPIEDLSHRVMADHVRSISLLMADGVLPSHEGRGYVLRRIIRRALRFGSYIRTGLDHLSEMVLPLCENMGETYPELLRAEPLIRKTLLHEAERFEHILAQGMRLIEASKGSVRNHIFPGDKAFQLYDTHGIPIDLIQDILSDEGIRVDQHEFERCLEVQKAASRQYGLGTSGPSLCDADTTEFWNRITKSQTPSIFCGYHHLEHEDKIHLILDPTEKTPLLELTGKGCIITHTTPFYAESGGQIGDRGWIKGSHGVMEVHHTEQKNTIFIHHGTMQQGSLKEGESVLLSVDTQHRQRIRCNHSATHLLHSALREVLGKHVTQKGSLVTADRLRFDFSHHLPLSKEELMAVEQWVNQRIWENLPVHVRTMPHTEALELGAMALFGEKYHQNVRVISMGDTDACASIELCGGTHVEHAGEIGLFKLLQESSIGSGIRRIEALTQHAALEYAQHLADQHKKWAQLLKTTPQGIEEKIIRLLALSKTPAHIACSIEKISQPQGTVWWGTVQEGEAKNIKPWIDTLRKDPEFDIGLFWCFEAKKCSLYIAVQEDRSRTHTALTLLKQIYHAVGAQARGGGRSTLAQGPWNNEAHAISDALQAIFQELDRTPQNA
jgi:alanyl-tRNA synthetase